MGIETYQDALHFWHSRVNYEQRGMPADLGELKLERMKLLLERLGHPESGQKIVHIAGTKGKGSVAALLANILRCAGKKVGLFTSPHLTLLEERVQVNGEPISTCDLTAHMRRIERAAQEVEALGELPPTFFEVITALGFVHFAQSSVDFTVLEVGLGGRFDATNVCTPLLSVITSISYDHTEQLGATLDRIAFEKAGIIKPGVPVVSGVLAPSAQAVIARIAEERGAPLHQLQRDFSFAWESGRIEVGEWPTISWRNVQKPNSSTQLKLGLWGRHQGENAAVALACIDLMRDHLDMEPSPSAAVSLGLQTVQWPGRIEVLSRAPWIILDCAHNAASVEALLETLQPIPARERLLLFAASRDKDLPGMLRLLTCFFTRAVFCQYSSSTRGADPDALCGAWLNYGGAAGSVVPQPAEALQQLRTSLRAKDMLCITGSVFLAGELRPLLLS